MKSRSIKVNLKMANAVCVLSGHDYNEKGICTRKTPPFFKGGKYGICGSKK